jgi:hypothetical protein
MQAHYFGYYEPLPILRVGLVGRQGAQFNGFVDSSALAQMIFLDFPRAKKPLGVQILSRALGKTLN